MHVPTTETRRAALCAELQHQREHTQQLIAETQHICRRLESETLTTQCLVDASRHLIAKTRAALAK
jgi:hypothetical protein